jgi:hypothetical protein
VYALVGENDAALQELEKLAKLVGGGPTYGDLRFDPLWDDLRGDRRFEKILTSVAPKEM